MLRRPDKQKYSPGKSLTWIAATVLAVFACVGTFASPALAQFGAAQDLAANTAQAAGINQQQDLVTIIGRLINIAIGFVGILLTVILIYAGFEYMTAGGDGEKVKKAVTRIRNAIIGLLIVASSFAIVNWILGMLSGAVMGGGIFGGGQTSTGGFGQWGNSGCLGQGGIVYHYPEPGQKDVARNTALAITFSDAVDPGSFIKDYSVTPSSTQLNTDMVKIHPANNSKDDLLSDKARVMVSKDGKTVIIKPNDPLGNSTTPVNYEVVLDGGIKTASGTAMCGGFKNGYTWTFQVSTKIDNTPPQVMNYFPSSGTWARNVVMQVNFNEPMMPISVSGFYKKGASSNFQNLTASMSQGNVSEILEGEWRISNGYKTAEFVTNDECGTNSCLLKMYCLPASSTVSALVRAATVSTNPPQAAEMGAFGFDGAVDMAGNSMDGNRDGKADGPSPGPDDVGFTFNTSEEIRIKSPVIESTDPAVKSAGVEGNVPLDKNVDVTWQKDSVLLMHTLDSNNVMMRAKGPKETDANTWFWYTKAMQLNTKGEEAKFGDEIERSKMTIYHRPFLPSDQPKNNNVWPTLNIYAPVLKHGIMDVYQNCFNPASSDLGNTGNLKEGTPNICNDVSTSKTCWQSDAWKPEPEKGP